MSRVVHIGHGTDTGKKRRRNEDEYVVQPPLFAIADGMGGAQAGELASSLAAANCAGCEVRGELAGLGAAHAVGDREQRRLDDVFVFVSAPLLTSVGAVP